MSDNNIERAIITSSAHPRDSQTLFWKRFTTRQIYSIIDIKRSLDQQKYHSRLEALNVT